MNCLPHLEGVVPRKGYGNRLSMYLIALEAWRRGLKVKFYAKDNPENRMLIRYSISNGKNMYHFESSRGDKLTNYAFQVCENKDETKKVLSKADIPVPEGKRFKENNTDEEIIAYANELGYPVVIKPISENAGKGVFSNLLSKEEVTEAVSHVRHTLQYKDIIVEKHINGVEHRIFVVDGKVHGVVNRIPANIVGDGKSTIKQLISLKNKSKRSNPNIASKLIKIDKEVQDSINHLGYTLESVPYKGEQIFLRSKSNVSTGGDPIDVTDELSDELKELAVKATKAIPGLGICGLDMIVDKERNKGVIIEINTKPMLGLHVYPVEGKPRDVVSPILDYYFPETKDCKKSNLFFDFHAAIAPLRDNLVKEIEILPISTLVKMNAKSYLISGSLLNDEYRNWIRLTALKYNLNGFVKVINNDENIQVVVAGEQKKLEQFIDECFYHSSQNETIVLDKKKWNKPIKIGFQNYSKSKKSNLKKSLEKEKRSKEKIKLRLEKEKKLSTKLRNKLSKLNSNLEQKNSKLEEIKSENNKLKNEKRELENAYIAITNSNSWKVTKPLRLINKIFKNN